MGVIVIVHYSLVNLDAVRFEYIKFFFPSADGIESAAEKAERWICLMEAKEGSNFRARTSCLRDSQIFQISP